jgi:hypothetical protein
LDVEDVDLDHVLVDNPKVLQQFVLELLFRQVAGLSQSGSE